MKIYLSLPITGYNLAERIEYANKKKKELHDGWGNLEVITPFDVVTPALSKEELTKEEYAEAMGKCISALIKCDAIYLCEDWQYSRGCNAEFEIAKIYRVGLV